MFGAHSLLVPFIFTTTVKPQSYGNKGVPKSEITVTLKLSAYLKICFVHFPEECAAVITMELKLACTEAKALCY